MHFGEEQSGPPRIEEGGLADAVVGVRAALDVVADGAERVVAGAHLVVADVHVMAVDVGPGGVPRLPISGTGDVAVGFAHVAQPQGLVVAVVPAGGEASHAGGGVLDEHHHVASDIAAVLIPIRLPVEGVVPPAVSTVRLEGHDLPAEPLAAFASPVGHVGAVGDIDVEHAAVVDHAGAFAADEAVFAGVLAVAAPRPAVGAVGA